MKTCPDCGERVYSLGCVNCNEEAYIDVQRAELGMEPCADARRRATGDYDEVEMNCRGCMGPCGRCHEAIDPDQPSGIDGGKRGIA